MTKFVYPICYKPNNDNKTTKLFKKHENGQIKEQKVYPHERFL